MFSLERADLPDKEIHHQPPYLASLPACVKSIQFWCLCPKYRTKPFLHSTLHKALTLMETSLLAQAACAFQKKRQSCANLQELSSLHLHWALATTPCCSGALARTQRRSSGPTPCCALARTQRRSPGPSPCCSGALARTQRRSSGPSPWGFLYLL